MILWRALLDAINVQWRDRGANTSRGEVSIKCPWCGANDPSNHLSINEQSGAYYCYRSQPPHRGRSAPYLLTALGVPTYQIDTLLQTYSDDQRVIAAPTIKPTPWQQFGAATTHPAALAYLKSRGFTDPVAAAQRYDLRFTISGRYAWRLLLPLRYNDEVIGFTGRAIGDQQPRYLTEERSEGACLYIPVYPTAATNCVVLVEGPFDALKIADAFPQHEITAIALLGLSLNNARLEHLISVVISQQNITRILLTLDSDQHRGTQHILRQSLAFGKRIPYAEPFPLPAQYKDAGEMPREALRNWYL